MHPTATTPPTSAFRRAGAAGRPAGRAVAVRLVALVLAVAGGLGAWTVRPPERVAAAARYPARSLGNDISFPQCEHPYPQGAAFGIVGVTGGRAFTGNPCFASEFEWARNASAAPSAYVNVNYALPGYASFAAHALQGPAGWCAPTQNPCTAYNYGWNAADDALERAIDAGAVPAMWWLDVETANYWADAPELNDRVIQAAVDLLRSRGQSVGVYSINEMWRTIAGRDFRPRLPVWYAETDPANGYPSADHYCDPDHAFTGGTVWLVQWTDNVDHDYACGAASGPPHAGCLPQPLPICLLTPPVAAAPRLSPGP
jgi:hypothetical protein